MANIVKHKRGSGNDPSASDLVLGELAIRTDNGKLFTKMDSGAIAEIAGGGSDIAINTLSSSSATGGGSATFNGSAYRFTLSSPPSVSAQQLLVSIAGVIQKPVAGNGQPSEGFSISGNDIILAQAPASGTDFFILTFRSLGVSEPADNTVTSAKIVDGTIVNADINASANITGTKISPNFGSQNIVSTGYVSVKDVYLTDSDPTVFFTDSTDNHNYIIQVNSGIWKVRDTTNSVDRLVVNSDGHVDVTGNLDVGETLTVTGNNPNIVFTDSNSNPDFKIYGSNGAFSILDSTNAVNRFVISSSGAITVGGNLDVGGNLTLSSGRLLLGTTTEGNSSADDLTIASSTSCGISIRSGTSNSGNVYFSDGTSGADEYRGFLSYSHTNNDLSIGVDAATRLQLSSSEFTLFGTYSGNAVPQTNLIFGIKNSNGQLKKAQITSNKVADISSTLEFGTTVSHTYAERMRIHNNGNVGINTNSPTDKLDVNGTAIIRSNLYLSNNVYLAANKGIYFNGNSGSSHHLDDYEEGTWTPSFYPLSSNIPITYTTREGKYTKIGNVVYWHFKIQVSNITGNRNQAFGISGFPHNITNSQDQASGNFYGETWDGEIPTTIKYFGNVNRGQLYYYADAMKYYSSSMLDINVNSSMLIGSGFYYTS